MLAAGEKDSDMKGYALQLRMGEAQPRRGSDGESHRLGCRWGGEGVGGRNLSTVGLLGRRADEEGWRRGCHIVCLLGGSEVTHVN